MSLTEDAWQQMRRLAEARNGAYRDNRHVVAELLLRHEAELTAVKQSLQILLKEVERVSRLIEDQRNQSGGR